MTTPPGGFDDLLAILQNILERQDTILERVDAIDSDLREHKAIEENAVRQLLASLPKKPDGSVDADGHRDFHVAMIEERRERAEMWRGIRAEMAKKTVFGVFGVVLFLFFYWWKTGHAL
jgi:hypothetical protein